MTKHISQEEHENYKSETQKLAKFTRVLFGLLLLAFPLSLVLLPPYQLYGALVTLVLYSLLLMIWMKKRYLRECPKCGGRIYWMTNVCRKCNVSVHRVGPKSEGSEWMD